MHSEILFCRLSNRRLWKWDSAWHSALGVEPPNGSRVQLTVDDVENVWHTPRCIKKAFPAYTAPHWEFSLFLTNLCKLWRWSWVKIPVDQNFLKNSARLAPTTMQRSKSLKSPLFPSRSSTCLHALSCWYIGGLEICVKKSCTDVPNKVASEWRGAP